MTRAHEPDVAIIRSRAPTADTADEPRPIGPGMTPESPHKLLQSVGAAVGNRLNENGEASEPRRLQDGAQRHEHATDLAREQSHLTQELVNCIRDVQAADRTVGDTMLDCHHAEAVIEQAQTRLHIARKTRDEHLLQTRETRDRLVQILQGWDPDVLLDPDCS